MSDQEPITVTRLGDDTQLWQQYLARAGNATLFHDLEFLRYHPAGRHSFHHLILMREGSPIGLLPGGLAGPGDHPMFHSPLGASVGGFAVDDLTTKTALDMVEAVQGYAREQSWAGIEITLPPSYYDFERSQVISFALFFRGFRLEHRWLCPVVELKPEPGQYELFYRRRQIRHVRAAKRKGMLALEGGLDVWEEFAPPFRDTYARHGVPATHTEEEIRDLLARLPARVRIMAALLDGAPVASLLVFKVAKSVVITFYICSSSELRQEGGPAFLISAAMDRYGAEGFKYLDLGPTASDLNFNAGNTHFKEGLGALGQCRDRWRWMVGA